MKFIPEKGSSTIRGTTSIFIFDKLCKDDSFKKFEITSKRITVSICPNVAAIQTLQFQKSESNLKGNACMIKHNDKWKLFFVWDAKFVNGGFIIGYMYTGKHLSNRELISLCLSRKSGDFYWVNLCQNQFPNTILPQLRFPIKAHDGQYFGNHSPSQIYLPIPVSKEPMIKSMQKVQPIKIGRMKSHLNNEMTNQLEFYHDYLKNTSYGLNSKPYHKTNHRRGSNKCYKIFQTKKEVTIPFLTIFQPKSYDTPYQEFLNKSEFYVVVPYAKPKIYMDDHPFCTVEYAFINSTKINMLQGLHENQYNAVLNKIQNRNVPSINQLL